MALQKQNHRYGNSQPDEEIVDLYKCTNCGQIMHLLVKLDPLTMYN